MSGLSKRPRPTSWPAPDPALVTMLEERRSGRLDSYRSSPVDVEEHVGIEVRLREGGYNDRQVYELIQNAADAAKEIQAPARVELILTADALYAANTGAPLTSEGITCLLGSHLSQKTHRPGDQIGRFGLGFKSVLAISSRPEIHSRTVSLRFDEQESRQTIEAVLGGLGAQPTPVMRLAWVTSTATELVRDPILGELCSWATTIVKLPLRTPDVADRTASALKDFPAEFMLFLDSSAQLTLQDRRTDWSRTCRVRSDDGDLLLDVEGELQRWRIFDRRVQVEGADVIADAGSLHLRDQLPLTWAVPLDARRGRDIANFRFWAFFPLTEKSRLPGIMNAPWKTNDDRTGMLRGRFNDFLLDRMAELVASSLDSLRSDEDPGRILDFLPRRDLGGDTAARLAEAVWKLVASRKIVADGDGVLKVATELAPHPEGVDPALLQRWAKLASPDARQRFVHPSVHSRADRLPRYRVLLKTAGKEEDAQDVEVGHWLETVFAPTATVAIEVIKMACEVHDSTKDVDDRASIKAAKIILLKSGKPGGGKWQTVYFAGDQGIPEGIPTVAPELEADLAVRASLQRVFGVRPFDAEAWATELGKYLIPPLDWAEVWNELHRAPTDVIGRTLEAALKAGRQVCVRSVGGAWRASDEVLLTGAIVPPAEAKDNAAFVVDDSFHREERPVLERIGFGQVPVPRPIRSDAAGLHMLLSPYEVAAVGHYFRGLSHHQRPQVNRLNVLDRASLSQPAGLLKEGSLPVRARLAAWLLINAQAEIQQTLRYGHDSSHSAVRDRYPVANNPNRLTWLLSEHGILDVAGRMTPVKDCVAILEQPWSQLLPLDEAVRKGLALLSAAIRDGWRPGAPPTKSVLWTILAERAHDRANTDSLRQQLYNYMGEAGVVPTSVAVGEDAVPIASLYVTTDEMLASSAKRSGLNVLGLSDKATRSFVAAGAHELKGQPVPAFESAEQAVPFEEAFWHLAAVITDEQIVRPLPDVIFCRKLRIEYEASGLSKKVHVDRVIWLVDERLYVDDGLVHENSLTEGLAREILRLLTAERYLSAANLEEVQRLAEHQAVLRRRRLVAAGPDLPARLLLAVDDQVDRLLQRFVPELRDAVLAGGYEDRRVAELFLSTFGIDALRELRDDLVEVGLDPPGRWGSVATVQFVESLGFPAEFAMSTTGSRDPFEIVSGPRPLNPLHDYQAELHRDLVEILTSTAENRRAMLSLPTGAGKTRVAVEAVVSSVLRTSNARPLVLWVAQRDELCEQAVRCFQHVWQNNGEESVDLRISRLWGAAGGRVAEGDGSSPHVVVATIQTLNNRFHGDTIDWLSQAGAVVIDEAHQGITPTYTQLLQWLNHVDPGTRIEPPIIGLSATPFRGHSETESQRLARRFHYRLLPGPDEQPLLYERLRREGVLARITHETLNIDTPFSFDAQELSEIATFNEVPSRALVRLARDTSRNDRIIACLLALPADSKVLFFANSVEHAQLIAGRLNLEGRRAAAVVSETRQGLRQQFIDQFQRGGLNLLTTHTVLATGFDAPKVDTIVISRPTFSPVLYQQMIGRGLRGPRNGGKASCRLITVLDNLDRFGDRLAFHEFVDLWRTEPIG